MATVDRLRSSDVHKRATDAKGAAFGTFGVLADNEWVTTDNPIEVRSPYNDDLAAVVHLAGPDLVEKAIATASRAFQVTRKLPTWKRSEVLANISEGIQAQREKFARAIAMEAGKPLQTARAEVDRAVFTFKVASEETRRIYGEIVPLDWLPGNEGRVGHVHHVPRGPVVGITPFNFPLNLVAHKVAPALAAGNPIIIRPGTQTPISSLMLGQLVMDAGWSPGGMQVVPTTTTDAKPFVEDDRIKVLSFTGSPAVGWMLKSQAGMKAVSLELGGNAGTIVHHDANVEYAASRVAWGAFSYSGQSCISVQRVYIHDAVFDEFVRLLVPKVEAMKVGNPLDEDTAIGPVIDSTASERIAAWIDEAVAAGAKVLTGNKHDGNLWQPTILTDINEEMKVACMEVFGPVVSLFRYSDPLEAVRAVDNSSFGLQAGLFTNDMQLVNTAFEEIEVGGLMVNDISTYRIDHMPYGGVKQSGFGREGLRYAIEEMSELKLLTFNRQ